MKKRLIISMLATLSLVFSGFGTAEDTEKPVADDLQRNVSYFFGFALGNNLMQGGIKEIDFQRMQQGIEDALKGRAANLSQQEQEAVVAEIQARQKLAQEAAMVAGLEASRTYLTENAKKPGVSVTESGLQYEVLVAGEGNSPAATDTVRVHYAGTLLSGQEFDSSIKRGEPAEFVLNQVIPGWTEGLQLMKTGAKYKLTIPPELGYGPGGTRGIPPNSVLIFEVELLAIK
jgi:FKBP-type peptidyl-prolyl cis-trans isomerase